MKQKAEREEELKEKSQNEDNARKDIIDRSEYAELKVIQAIAARTGSAVHNMEDAIFEDFSALEKKIFERFHSCTAVYQLSCSEEERASI